MKVKALFILTLAVLFLSACSSARFGHIPRGKRQKHTTKKEASKWKKEKLHYVKVSPKKPTISTPKKANKVKIVEQEHLKVSLQAEKRKSEKGRVKIITPPTKKEIKTVNKKAATKRQQKTNDFWEGFWGELVAEIIAGLILIAIAAFFLWLEAIGLGWLAAVIGIIILILIIVWIGGIIQDFFDMIFS
jgi:Flp pilus assembly protein TadB